MSTRRQAREAALQSLYLVEQNPDTTDTMIRDHLRRSLNYKQLERFAMERVEGVRTHQTELDASIAAVSENWDIHRMPIVDRNTLRLAAYELRYCPDVPTGVAINEALEICKRFSSGQAHLFVNGILDRLARRFRGERFEPAVDSEPETPADDVLTDASGATDAPPVE